MRVAKAKRLTGPYVKRRLPVLETDWSQYSRGLNTTWVGPGHGSVVSSNNDLSGVVTIKQLTTHHQTFWHEVSNWNCKTKYHTLGLSALSPSLLSSKLYFQRYMISFDAGQRRRGLVAGVPRLALGQGGPGAGKVRNAHLRTSSANVFVSWQDLDCQGSGMRC